MSKVLPGPLTDLDLISKLERTLLYVGIFSWDIYRPPQKKNPNIKVDI
jgi:hypothetical protein